MMARGARNRAVAETKMNDRSSRSHQVCLLEIWCSAVWHAAAGRGKEACCPCRWEATRYPCCPLVTCAASTSPHAHLPRLVSTPRAGADCDGGWDQQGHTRPHPWLPAPHRSSRWVAGLGVGGQWSWGQLAVHCSPLQELGSSPAAAIQRYATSRAVPSAGSERVSRSGAEGQQLLEAQHINKSLRCGLGGVGLGLWQLARARSSSCKQ